MKVKHGISAAMALALSTGGEGAYAQTTGDDTEIAELRRQLIELKEQQRRNAEALDRSMQQITALQEQLATVDTEQAAAASAPVVAEVASDTSPGLSLSGDVRVRYEANYGTKGAHPRSRGVLRARLRAAYEPLDWLKVGGQIVTGDVDDPNTADVTLGNFDDDLQVALDQAYVQLQHGGFTVTGGKFGNPFIRTDLVWDGDVSPQGVAASFVTGDTVQVGANGLLFLIDENSDGEDSSMLGGQLWVAAHPGGTFDASLAGAYYDYNLVSLATADSGDFRSNLIGEDGRYLSDFNLVDVIGQIGWSGLGKQWPMKVLGEFVRNTGAATGERDGFQGAITFGRASKPGDLRFGYGYMQAERDAVLAAFSHDNLGFGTDYMLHALSIDYVLDGGIVLNGTFYDYAELHLSDPSVSRDWQQRLRLNMMVSF